MAFRAKFTAKLGQVDLEHIAVAAGTAEAQGETISVNIDQTSMGKGEALQLLDSIAAKIHAEPWPPLA